MAENGQTIARRKRIYGQLLPFVRHSRPTFNDLLIQNYGEKFPHGFPAITNRHGSAIDLVNLREVVWGCQMP
jgi:hypothetical protein